MKYNELTKFEEINLESADYYHALLCVRCNTYNHAKYIEDTMEGFLNQKTNFRFYVLIIDDASDDGTSDIIRRYAKKYPTIIKALIAHTNTFHSCRRYEMECAISEKFEFGKYIALCEGDDYWIDPYKLQIQVDYMEKNKLCTLHCHNGIEHIYRSNKLKMINNKNSGIMKAGDYIVLQETMIPTSSLLLRKSCSRAPNELASYGVGDYPLILNAGAKGEIYYEDRIMTVYRFGHDGSWSSDQLENPNNRILHLYQMIELLRTYNNLTKSKYYHEILTQVYSLVENIISYLGNLSSENGNCNNDLESNPLAVDYYNDIIAIYKQVEEPNFVRTELVDYISCHDNIYLLGAGKYASVLYTQLETNGISITGVVTSENTEKLFHDRKVHSIDSIPQNAGIIIGIRPIHWNKIIESLKKKGLSDFYSPYLLYI